MECPFCAEEVKDEALVCKHCSRDLKIPKPLIEENQELIATRFTPGTPCTRAAIWSKR